MAFFSVVGFSPLWTYSCTVFPWKAITFSHRACAPLPGRFGFGRPECSITPAGSSAAGSGRSRLGAGAAPLRSSTARSASAGASHPRACATSDRRSRASACPRLTGGLPARRRTSPMLTSPARLLSRGGSSASRPAARSRRPRSISSIIASATGSLSALGA